MNNENKNITLDTFQENKKMSIKKVFLQLKLYGEEHPTLTIGIITILTTIFISIIKLGYYSYKVGWYFHYGVKYIPNNIDSNNLLTIFFYASFTCVIVLLNILGYIFYNNGKFCFYFFRFTGFLYIAVMIYGVSTYGFNELIRNSILMFILILDLSSLLHVFIFIYAFSQPTKMKIKRNEILLERAKRNGKKKRIDKYEQKKLKLQNKDSKGKIINNKDETYITDDITKFFYTICCIGIGIFFFSIFGYLESTNNKKMETIKLETVFQHEEKSIDIYAVMFQVENSLIVSPCIDEDGQLTVFSLVQIQVEKMNTVINNKKYKEIVPNHDDVPVEIN